tara:strand:+ start:16736 stop:18544 length:1809 start_codon:yes stop_codon:yes gene_type:complete
MMRLTKLRTFTKLGFPNLVRVGKYRIGIKSGLHPVLKQKAELAQGPFFRASERATPLPPANNAWDDAIWWFDWYSEPRTDSPPNWFSNPFSTQTQPDAGLDWWCVPDFGSGDIKGLWEISRFGWVLAWSTKAAHGDNAALERLNWWLADWAEKNPPYKGPNWKCGQEASIRVMHLVTAAWILGQDKSPEKGLVDLIRGHLQRIAPTMSYAIGQQNNHGTSEAAALFIGGRFLAELDPRAKTWERRGRRWLEERAQALIETDGSFSQYSVAYHRVLLDTYSLAEAWRRYRMLPPFSKKLSLQLQAAARWLEAFTDSATGDAPNIGANDGARLLPLTSSDYRDFRPSVQLAVALFDNRNAYGDGAWNIPLKWLDVQVGRSPTETASISFDKGGYHILRNEKAMAVLRYPRFRFRPSQSDALHLDLWHAGRNLLSDAGSYSYNAEGAAWYGSTAAHNTIEFDGRDQMPRLSRFLFGDWLKADAVDPVFTEGETISAAAAYTDGKGARHKRHVSLGANYLICTDTISGKFKKACMRWRLPAGNWELLGQTLRSDDLVIQIEQRDDAEMSISLGTTRQSRYYQHDEETPLLSIRLNRPTTITTKVTF